MCDPLAPSEHADDATMKGIFATLQKLVSHRCEPSRNSTTITSRCEHKHVHFCAARYGALLDPGSPPEIVNDIRRKRSTLSSVQCFGDNDAYAGMRSKCTLQENPPHQNVPRALLTLQDYLGARCTCLSSSITNDVNLHERADPAHECCQDESCTEDPTSKQDPMTAVSTSTSKTPENNQQRIASGLSDGTSSQHRIPSCCRKRMWRLIKQHVRYSDGPATAHVLLEQETLHRSQLISQSKTSPFHIRICIERLKISGRSVVHVAREAVVKVTPSFSRGTKSRSEPPYSTRVIFSDDRILVAPVGSSGSAQGSSRARKGVRSSWGVKFRHIDYVMDLMIDKRHQRLLTAPEATMSDISLGNTQWPQPATCVVFSTNRPLFRSPAIPRPRINLSVCGSRGRCSSVLTRSSTCPMPSGLTTRWHAIRSSGATH